MCQIDCQLVAITRRYFCRRLVCDFPCKAWVRCRPRPTLDWLMVRYCQSCFSHERESRLGNWPLFAGLWSFEMWLVSICWQWVSSIDIVIASRGQHIFMYRTHCCCLSRCYSTHTLRWVRYSAFIHSCWWVLFCLSAVELPRLCEMYHTSCWLSLHCCWWMYHACSALPSLAAHLDVHSI